MPYKNIFSKFLTALVLWLFLCANGFANTPESCDLLIKQGIEAMGKKDHVRSLELLTRARSLAEKNYWYKQQFLATNNIGANYYTLLDYGEALNYYLESYAIAKKKLSPKFEMVVLNNIAILYSKEKKFDKAADYFTRAYSIARKNKDTLKTGLYLLNLGSLANETKDAEAGRRYINQALPYLRSKPDFLIQAKVALIENLLLRNQNLQARTEAESLYETTQNLEYNNTGTLLRLAIAKSYMQEKDYAPALAILMSILATKPDPELTLQGYEMVADIYIATGKAANALQYKDSVIRAEKKINEIKNGRLFETGQVKFEVRSYKNQIALNEQRMAADRNFFYAVIAVIIAIVSIVILVLRNRSERHRQKKLIAERNEQMTALELEKGKNKNLLLEKELGEKEAAALLEQEKLKSEIESRNRKLSAKALYLSGRNQLIEEIIAALSQVPGISQNPYLSGHIKTLKSHLKSDDEWDSFIIHFEEVNSGFLHKLKTLHPTLTANDIRFLSYIYMNLSNKEISAMLNVTPEACRKRKERLGTKMELKDHTLLYDYLSTL